MPEEAEVAVAAAAAAAAAHLVVVLLGVEATTTPESSSLPDQEDHTLRDMETNAQMDVQSMEYADRQLNAPQTGFGIS